MALLKLRTDWKAEYSLEGRVESTRCLHQGTASWEMGRNEEPVV